MEEIFASNGKFLQYTHTLDPHPDQGGFVMHAHDGCEILYILTGQGTYVVESTEYPLQDGCLLVMRPGEVHRMLINSGLPYDRMVLHFREQAVLNHADIYRQLLAPFTERPLGTGNLYTSDEIDGNYIARCLRQTEQPGDGSMAQLLITANLPAILSELYRAYCRRQRQTAGQLPPAQPRIREILNYVNDHIHEELSLDALCQQFYISKTQLGRLFRTATGSTAWDYILVKRLIEARQQILAGKPVTQACLACGFQDYSAFFRAYRKRYGTSPTADREKTFSAR